MKNNNKGFSLVELIVVIAIMAILAAVAVVGVSVYIPKAQQASDKQLVSDLQYVLDLHAQSTPEDVTAGYVILSPTENAKADSDFVIKVLEATYGADWETELKLEYGEWTNDGMLELVAKYDPAALDKIANSSFMNSSTDGMLQAVTGMTGLIGDVIQKRGMDTPEEARTHLESLFGEGSDILSKYDELKNSELTAEEEATAISNLLVGTMADTMKDNPAMQTMVNMYASAYNYAEATGDDTALKQMQTNLQSLDLDVFSSDDGTDEDLEHKGFIAITKGISKDDDNPCREFAIYMESNTGADKIADDNEALAEMMGAVKQIAGGFQDKESLIDEDLFASPAVADQVDNYLNSVKALAGIEDFTVLQNLEAGSVVILVAADGSVSVVPAMN